MKRGKDDDKSMGPMFPRLHVNDTEKGGPRAPPRNKMALYEQLSIPSQRFGNGVLPLNPNSAANHASLQSSSSQGGMSEKGSRFHQQPPSVHPVDKTNNRYSDLNNQFVQPELKKKPEEDDFRVPIFDGNGTHQNKDNEGPSCFSDRLTQNNPRELAKFASNQSSRQSPKTQFKENDGSSGFRLKNASNNSNRLPHNANFEDRLVDWGNSVSNEAIGAVRDIQQEVVRSPNDPTNADAVSETSMVDFISGVDISPDDVVGIIGQKHFWKARRAIVNQQRVFAVQVFELHRLIKVQRLIAGSPQLMVEDAAFLGKPAKVSLIKKIPLEYVLKSGQNMPKLKDFPVKPHGNRREFSAENGVDKPSLESTQTSSQTTFSGYPFLSQPPGHQWLIPVMSPSEGLIYKPYPGPGYMTPGPGPPPVIGHNFVNYGVPPPQPLYQWPAGFHPVAAPPAAHGYFPPYGMQYQRSNDVEVQVSTAGSTTDKACDPLFPVADGIPPPPRVIRVVPHNARSATESVARIFRSIQEERKQHDLS